MSDSGLIENARVLFTGDSITDCGRSYTCDSSLVGGCSLMFSDYMKLHFPDDNITVLNTGIAGDALLHLYFRLQKDCIALEPDYIILQIGVNDAWNGWRGGEPFEKSYRLIIDSILTQTQTHTRLILIDPVLLEATAEIQKNCVIANINSYISTVAEMQEIVYQLAFEYCLDLIPLSEIVHMELKSGTPTELLSADGIHPAPRLYELMFDQIMLRLNVNRYQPHHSYGGIYPTFNPRKICISARQKTILDNGSSYFITDDTKFYLKKDGIQSLVARGREAVPCRDYRDDLYWFDGFVFGKKILDGLAEMADKIVIVLDTDDNGWLPKCKEEK